MRIKIWGCRGSMPSPGAQTIRYGGETTCLEIFVAGKRLIIDAGSGIRQLGKKMMAEGKEGEATLLFTHLHWDHLAGFPFFRPAYLPGYTFRVCGGYWREEEILPYLRHQMEAPYFPVNFSYLNATISEGCRCDEGVCPHGFPEINGLACQSIPLNHPNGGFGFKFSHEGHDFVFLTDTELGFNHPGAVSREEYLEFCQGVDLLIHDAQYTDRQYQKTRGWGHSTYSDAVDFAVEAGVRRLGLFHHDPDRTDRELDVIGRWCRKRIADRGGETECFVCADGMELKLG